ncbi:MraY family glycosyltransferase [Ectothiorhodospira marina]|uniref:Fuc2NAc and GlcNAc transferase n=1 Tax=Ectothiorhodospira marina TaxID=1396821 RepID=A0A1H7RKD6_9GAMM|nr:glycosyltransferase family 4 protein [Ectothiorhodospira marina]SEL60683.1 Fuc2NAc and GlcNAc transferase [Ectothiorhodospira marina]
MGWMVFLGAACVAAFLFTGVLRGYALKTGMLDVPNARSSHEAPTPRGGGLSVVVVVLLGLPVLFWGAGLEGSALVALGLGGALVAAIGWLDDHIDVAARWRLLVHLLAGAWVVFWAGGAPALPLPGGDWAWGWLGVPILVLFVGWVLNLYNFMDGIDGIAGVETVTVAGVAAGLLWWVGAPGWALMAALLAVAGVGFLVWNWPPAKIFMGDAGSGFIGFTLAAMAVLTWAGTDLTIWVWLILLGVFIVDATLTLFRRLLRGERVYEAHRSHAYQQAARACGRHLPVTVAVGVINLVWLAPWAWAAVVWPEWGVVMVGVAWAPLVGVWVRYQ